jgi:hypothetical protein
MSRKWRVSAVYRAILCHRLFVTLTTVAALASVVACGDNGDEQNDDLSDRPTVSVGSSGDEDESSDDASAAGIPPMFEISEAESSDGQRVAVAIRYGQQPTEQMDALMEGELSLDGTCLGVASEFNDSFIPVVWPAGYSVDFTNGEFILKDDDGAVIAREGEIISMGGGNAPDPDGTIADVAPADCTFDSYWMSGFEVRLASEHDSEPAHPEGTPEQQTEQEAIESDAQYYAEDFDVVLGEAIRRLDLQGRLQDQPIELEENESERFAGIFWEHEPDYRLVVLMTDGDEDAMRDYFDDPELLDILEVRKAEYTLAELYEAQEEITEFLFDSGVLASSGTNLQENRVEIYVRDASIVEQALDSASKELPEYVVIIEHEDDPEPRNG